MQEFIITTPEQLKTVISETVKEEFSKHRHSLSVSEKNRTNDIVFITRKQAVILVLRVFHLIITIMGYHM